MFAYQANACLFLPPKKYELHSIKTTGRKGVLKLSTFTIPGHKSDRKSEPNLLLSESHHFGYIAMALPQLQLR